MHRRLSVVNGEHEQQSLDEQIADDPHYHGTNYECQVLTGAYPFGLGDNFTPASNVVAR